MTDTRYDRRSLLKIAGVSLGIGALYRAAPLLGADAGGILDAAAKRNGERPSPFSFVQLSDTHVGFNGPPNPTGTAAFERAVDMINALPQKPDLVLVTGDLTHDTEKPGEHAERMKLFKSIAGRLQVKTVKLVPGEHDAGEDGGALFREAYGATSYAFDHKGVHFVALDNVSRGKPTVGAEQLAWLKKDLARFTPSTPIVVFTHRPLFDLEPDWEWFTQDGDEVMNALAPFENVTVLYGHIHRAHHHQIGTASHHAARPLIFAFPDPATGVEKKPMPFDREQPFKNLGIRVATERAGRPAIDDVELSAQKFAGLVGVQQLVKEGAWS